MRIGPYRIDNPLVLAPMAGVTDRPFRQLCRSQGAGLAVGEMLASNPDLRQSRKSRLRRDHQGEPEPRIVQIAGADPATMADAARYNVEQGARIIDINMGCPAKKVCNKSAGSALLADEALVSNILEAVVAAVDVPVTLKMRTGVSPDRRNAVRIARLAEQAGIQALALHGRTRQDLYRGEAEYDTIARVKQAISIPLMANGDIDSPEKAAHVLRRTGADALMIGRGAHGRPWLFGQIRHYLATGEELPEPAPETIARIVDGHLRAMHDFYGVHQGVRMARKHIGWYLDGRPGGEALRRQAMRLECPLAQRRLLGDYFRRLADSQAA
ncbi:tRNA dihydrouridine synthase DusB [Alkalilimnicola sp. S0819]|uniref:tRNA dihydrouridine synthase DusB n=1 Tax=Alkalilimnicola sp. S0819 TaxID=2613922 RepID=UPI001261FEBB|nr:tRNA dihydrouridine synthase DusB [Alkalilimnicola sp. S0819]KAB7627584.1 tRNA dihydrouridine synthase DusB [Alkalilimnicola sp. S0819]MPQ15745.1 tRNA dihydrouridine synthase DusB [Alkalilimnicola sp. S0819]